MSKYYDKLKGMWFKIFGSEADKEAVKYYVQLVKIMLGAKEVKDE
ncbi:MAG: hypothetical protein DDT23_00839 [candidate division WS2 bacterium]|nr:hypothetical protein [Candidatus Lithacetigena glycinireducens]